MKAAALELARYLNAGSRTLSGEEALLVRTLAYLSQAPNGYAFKGTGSTYQLPARSQREIRAHQASGQTETGCGQHVSSSSQVTLARADNSTTDDDSITLLACDSSQNPTSHDATDHGFRTSKVRSGPASGIDRGRCGIAGTLLQTGWTQDCLDHDYCSERHDSAGGYFDDDCGDEFAEADEDFLLTFPNECASSRTTSGSRRPPGNTVNRESKTV